jgi:predicted ATP-grasp superfamily ATP-dependent carboligase
LSEAKSFKLFTRQKFDSSSLIVAWNQDVARLGSKVVDYISRELKCRPLGEISPEDFFSLSGVSVESDVAQFPESKFYGSRNKNLVFFKSDIPRFDWYQFINIILDVAVKYFGVMQIYTIGGMVLPGAHTMPRTLLPVVNSPEMKKILERYDVFSEMDYETQDGQRPTFSSYLIWAAKNRGISGACLWVPVPFYLMTVEDPQACKKVLELLNEYLKLNIDFTAIDNEVTEQNIKIAEARRQYPELDRYISKLEGNLGLTAEEGEKLVKDIDALLGSSRQG